MDSIDPRPPFSTLLSPHLFSSCNLERLYYTFEKTPYRAKVVMAIPVDFSEGWAFDAVD